ncbi:hypothetical protein AB6D11_00245 [Vibrio splendidus]
MTLSSLCYQYVLMDYIKTHGNKLMSKNDGELLLCNQRTSQLHFTIKPNAEDMERLASGDVSCGIIESKNGSINSFTAPDRSM